MRIESALESVWLVSSIRHRFTHSIASESLILACTQTARFSRLHNDQKRQISKMSVTSVKLKIQSHSFSGIYKTLGWVTYDNKDMGLWPVSYDLPKMIRLIYGFRKKKTSASCFNISHYLLSPPAPCAHLPGWCPLKHWVEFPQPRSTPVQGPFKPSKTPVSYRDSFDIPSSSLVQSLHAPTL